MSSVEDRNKCRLAEKIKTAHDDLQYLIREKGWTYNWFAYMNGVNKQCCMVGALKARHPELTGDYFDDNNMSLIALRAMRIEGGMYKTVRPDWPPPSLQGMLDVLDEHWEDFSKLGNHHLGGDSISLE